MSDIEQFDFEEIKNALAKSDEEAEERYKKFKSNDPFPEIDPALLNSADFIDYVIATGMLFPFYLEKAKIKPASYEISVLGKCILFEKGKPITQIICEGDDFILKKNSIAFVSLEPMFRIPDYIALRFNLKIKHVYKGLLLGTGPIIDPGFEGYLSFPLHNLTNNDYVFKGGEGLIYIEFTKLSTNRRWNISYQSNEKRLGKYIQFDKLKNLIRKDVEDYISRAAPNIPIISSMAEVIEKADNAEKSADKAHKTTKFFVGVGVVGLVALIISVYNLICSTNSYLHNIETQNLEYQKVIDNKVENYTDEIILLEGKIDSLMTQIHNEKNYFQPSENKHK